MRTIVDDHMTRDPQTIGADQTLETASEMMRLLRVRHLPVRAHGKLVGVLSERNISRYLVLNPVRPHVAHVREAMNTQVYAVAPGTPLSDVAREMATRRCGSVVVVDDGKVVGIFTTVDLARVLANTLVTLEHVDDDTPAPAVH